MFRGGEASKMVNKTLNILTPPPWGGGELGIEHICKPQRLHIGENAF